MRDQCVKVNSKYGIEIVAEETYGPRDSDMTAQLTNLKGAPGIQALVNPGMGQGPAIVTRNVRQLGITLPLYQSHGVASKSFIELAGEAADGVRLPAAAILVADKLPDSDPQKPSRWATRPPMKPPPRARSRPSAATPSTRCSS